MSYQERFELPPPPPLPAGKHYHAVGLGTNVVDRVALVKRTALADDKVTVVHHEIHPGGAVANNLAQAARLGLRCAWLGFLGDDDDGHFLRGELRRAGIDDRFAVTRKRAHTPHSFIAVTPDGERAIYMFPEVNRLLTPAHIDRLFAKAIRKAVHFHTEVAQQPVKSVLRAMEVARRAGTRTLLDLDVPPEHAVSEGLGTRQEIDDLLGLTDVLKSCGSAARSLTASQDLERAILQLLTMGPSVVVVTDGARGAILADQHEMVKVGAVKISVRDTTGAGDAFMGALSYGLASGLPLKECGLVAARAAACCISRLGSRSQAGYQTLRTLLRGRDEKGPSGP